MYKAIFFVALFVLISISVFGQSTFHKNIPYPVRLFSSTPKNNGEILGSGLQHIEYAHDQGLLVRFNQDGNVIWKRRFPGLSFIQKTIETENGYVLTGDTVKSSGPLPRPYNSVVAKIASNGIPIWSKKFVSAIGKVSIGNLMDGDNNYFLSGNYIPNDLSNKQTSIIIKLDTNGSTLWNKIYLADVPNHFNTFAAQTIEGDTLYACGHIQLNGCFVRINLHTGEIISISSMGGIYHDAFTTLKPTQDGNFILAGYTRSTTGSEESRPWVVKVNREGQIIWSKTYNLLGTSLTCDMAEAKDGGFVLAMEGDNSNSGLYAIIAKIDASGNLLWAYNYAGGQHHGIEGIQATSDGGFMAIGFSNILKSDNLGRISNGCCPIPITFQIEDYQPTVQHPVLVSENLGGMTPYILQTVVDTSFKVYDFCQTAIASIVEQVQLCQEDSIQINGVYYHAPNTVRDTVQNLSGGCDTVYSYNLIQIPQPYRVETISFCPGTSVTIEGITYSQPDTIRRILPATTGCDTFLVTFLKLNPFPKKYQTTTFCPGDTVFLDGISYLYPTILSPPDTLPGSILGCDTLLYQVLAYPDEPSTVSLICPQNLEIRTDPATPALVNYPSPIASGDCSCPEIYISLDQGLPSGSLFPVGMNQVCYSANDACGDYRSCCFDINIKEEAACDVKETACIRYEMLGISSDTGQNKTYRIRVTNKCASPLSYTAFQLPNGVNADAPVQNSAYLSPEGRAYTVRNPNHAPFHSIRFKPVDTGISNGAFDIFEYSLPAQSTPVFTKVSSRLASGISYEAILNTFNCTIEAERPSDRTAQGNVSPGLQVFPNPVRDELFIDFSGRDIVSGQLRILNLHGQELMQAAIKSAAGIQGFKIPEAMSDGLYFLEFKDGQGEKHLMKFIRSR